MYTRYLPVYKLWENVFPPRRPIRKDDAMSKKIRLGYDILSKRAIETESGVNIDEALKRITSYKRVPGTGEDNRPDEPRPSTKVIYIVKVDGASQPDTYKEWIWNQPVDGVGNWECIGGTSDDANSWKRWSENRGSTGEGESVYLGVNDVANRDETYILGKGNTVSVTDETDYTSTDVVEIGSENTATDAANTYQLGRENTVTGNNLANKEQYPHSMAMNLGRNNSITGEGVNIGKDNVSSTFGVTVGEKNNATNASYAIGNQVNAHYGSVALGNSQNTYPNTNTLEVIVMSVNGQDIPAEKTKPHFDGIYMKSGGPQKRNDGVYRWTEVDSDGNWYSIFHNYTLHQHLIAKTNGYSSRQAVYGYFNDQGEFIESTDPSHDIHKYRQIYQLTTFEGDVISANFYCSVDDSDGWDNMQYIVAHKFSNVPDNELPDVGDIINDSEYTDLVATKLYASFSTPGQLYVTAESDYTIAYTPRYSNWVYYDNYEVYGYYDEHNTFIPYNTQNSQEEHTYIWKLVEPEKIYTKQMTFQDLGVTIKNPSATQNSIVIGNKGDVSYNSFGVALGYDSCKIDYDSGHVWYEDLECNTRTINQADGSWSTSSTRVTFKRLSPTNDRTDFFYHITPTNTNVSVTSIGIFNNTGTVSNNVTTSSVGIGNDLKVDGNSHAFGQGISVTGGSTAVGHYLTNIPSGSIVVGNSINLTKPSDYSGWWGGFMAFGMDGLYPKPGSVIVGRSSVTAAEGCLAVGLNSISATGGSIVYGRNGISAEGSSAVFGQDGTYAKGRSMALGLSSAVSAESSGLAIGLDGYVRATSCALAMGVREGSVIAYGNALAIGLGAKTTSGSSTTTVNATYRSASFGVGDVAASYNSMAVGKDGASATNGGMIFGKSSYIADQGMGFGTGLDTSGGFAFGCGMAARSAGLSIGTTSIGSDTDASPYRIGDWVDMDGVNATLFAYLNPDGQYVPLQGYLQPTKGTINCCAYYKNIEHDGTTYPYAITESSGSTSNNPYWWDYNQQTWRYIVNSANDDLFQITTQKIYYGLLHQYVDNNGKTVYEVIDVPSDDKLNEDSNIVQTYYAVQSQTFTKDGNTYVYGTGLGYDDNGTPLYELTDMYIPLNDNQVSRRNQKWSPAVLGYYSNEASEWQNRWKDDFSRMSTTASVSIGGGAAHHTSFTFGQYAQGNLDYPNITNLIHSNGSGSFIPQRLEITKVYLADNQSIKICNGCNNTSDTTSILVGFYGNNSRWRSMIIGQQNNFAEGTSFIAGLDNNVAVSRSIAVGSDNISSGQSIAVGYNAYAYEHGASFGRLVRASNDGVAIGINSEASAYSVLLGLYSQSSKMSSTVGYYSKARDNSISIGNNCCSSNFGISIGHSCTSAERTMAIGHNNTAFDAGIAIGSDCSAVEQSVAVGINNKMGVNNIAFGINNSYIASSTGMAIGIDNTIGYGGYNIVAGKSNKAAYETISIGTTNDASGWSIALGVHNTSYNGTGGHATMIGQYNTSTSNQETIHKEFQIYVDGEPTQEQIEELTGMESAYRRLLDPYLDSEMIAYLNTTDAGNNDYYFGRADEMAWGYSSYFSWLQTLGNQPPIIFSSADRTALEAIMQQQPQTLEDYKTLMLQICGIVQNYANVDNLRSATNAATTMDDLDAIWNTKLWKDIMSSLQWPGDPIPGVVPNYDALQQILDAYRTWTSYGLSLRSSLAPHYETIEEDVVCNSFLAGNHNTSNHYNSILIGALNESKNPLVQPDSTYHTTDDDGFMIAVGYRNVVGRNYDMAFGYRSKAIGGENVALQHSEAEGYRNFAAFNSKMKGIGNVGLVESILNIDQEISGGYLDEISATEHNLFFNSVADQTSAPEHGYMQNVVLDAKLVTDSLSVTENFIYGGAGGNYTPIELSAKTTITGNTILGSQHGNTKLQISVDDGAMVDNIICRPSEIVVNAHYAFNRNILIGKNKEEEDYYNQSKVMAISDADTVIKNIVIHGSITGTANLFAHNIVMQDSKIESSYKNSDRPVRNNILFNSSTLTHSSANRWWTGIPQPTADNFFIGTNGSDTLACFSVSDPAYGASITNSLRIFNFGDNYITNTMDGHVFGDSNTIAGTKKFFITGEANQVVSNVDYQGHDSSLAFVHIFGSDNYILNDKSVSSYNTRNTIIGCKNKINGTWIGDNTIIGGQNIIGTDSTTWSGSQKWITECNIFGSDNHITSNVNAFTVIGKSNNVSDSIQWTSAYEAIGNGFVQGNNNYASNGSNIVVMGNGNNASGHNSVAIGCQLISSKWQTVIGKYNLPITGPDRLASQNPQDPSKALFIIGNGYSTKDNYEWQNPQYITRSNAMVVYADGTVKAKAFVSDEPTLALTGAVDQYGTGINVTETATETVVSLDTDTVDILNIIKNRPTTGKYVLESNNGTLSWVNIGTIQV